MVFSSPLLAIFLISTNLLFFVAFSLSTPPLFLSLPLFIFLYTLFLPVRASLLSPSLSVSHCNSTSFPWFVRFDVD